MGAQARGIWEGFHLPPVLLDILFQFMVAGAVATFIALNALFIIWFERKISARMQVRRGPNRVGIFGVLQTVADMVKLMIKEDITPKATDKVVFFLAPLIVLSSTFLAFVVVPFGKGLTAADLNIGVLYFIAVTGLTVIGILAAGWSSNNKYSLMGGMRSAAQIVSYEIPNVLVMLSIVMLAGSMKMGDIIAAQPSVGYMCIQPVAFIIFLIASNAEINRGPFDLPEAESELVSGFLTEYSAMKFAFFFLAEFTNLFIAGAMGATLFLGGWRGPVLPPVVWFIIKAYIVVFILMWILWTFPRIRVDHLMEFSWKFLVPIALLNLIVSAFIIKLF
jgi:NADH-quinone oxidoreductase subunit H